VPDLPDSRTHVPETEAGKRESIYGAGFWSVCHWYKALSTLDYSRRTAHTGDCDYTLCGTIGQFGDRLDIVTSVDGA